MFSLHNLCQVTLGQDKRNEVIKNTAWSMKYEIY